MGAGSVSCGSSDGARALGADVSTTRVVDYSCNREYAALLGTPAGSYRHAQGFDDGPDRGAGRARRVDGRRAGRRAGSAAPTSRSYDLAGVRRDLGGRPAPRRGFGRPRVLGSRRGTAADARRHRGRSRGRPAQDPADRRRPVGAPVRRSRRRARRLALALLGRLPARHLLRDPAADLEAASLVGGGDMRIDRVEGDEFSASVAGSGDLDVAALRVDDARFSIAGSGDLVARGSARRSRVSIAGSGNVRAREVTSDEASISIAGSGDVALTVRGRRARVDRRRRRCRNRRPGALLGVALRRRTGALQRRKASPASSRGRNPAVPKARAEEYGRWVTHYD